MNGIEPMVANLTPYQDLTDFPSIHSIQVNNCGMKQNYPSHEEILRPSGRRDYSILYLDSGWIKVNYGGELIRLDAGNAILYMPGARQVTTFSAEGNPVVYYIYFTGESIKETMDLFRTEESVVFDVENRTALKALFHQIVQVFRPLKVLNGRHPVFQPTVNGLLFQIIDLLLQSKEKTEKPERNIILPAMTYMSEHYHEQITLEECAALVNLSVGRFAHLFTKHIGISPYRFILSLRMDEAKELLVNSSMNINDVAIQTGFTDPCYFSRLFRKYAGCSPKDYRGRT